MAQGILALAASSLPYLQNGVGDTLSCSMTLNEGGGMGNAGSGDTCTQRFGSRAPCKWSFTFYLTPLLTQIPPDLQTWDLQVRGWGATCRPPHRDATALTIDRMMIFQQLIFAEMLSHLTQPNPSEPRSGAAVHVCKHWCLLPYSNHLWFAAC